MSDSKKVNLYTGKPMYIKKGQEVGEYTVNWIGNKYFTVLEDRRNKFEKSTLSYKSEYGTGRIQLYETKEEIVEEIEILALSKKVEKFFSRWGPRPRVGKLSKQQLIDIVKIIEPTSEN